MPARSKKPVPRYAAVASATMPGTLPERGRRAPGVEVVHAAISEPNRSLAGNGKRQRVAVNACVDVLEHEHRMRRISVAAYQAGRNYQLVLEMAAGVRVGSEDSGVRHSGSPDFAMIAGITNAKALTALLADTLPIVGMQGEAILRLALASPMGFAEIAAALTHTVAFKGVPNGKINDRVIGRVAQRFRDDLEALAVHWSVGRIY